MIRADMQRIVNGAVTAAADEGQACGAGDLDLMQARALVAARELGFTGNDGDLVVQAGLLEPDTDNPDQLAFTVTTPARSNAALVSYTREEPASFLLPSSLVPSVELAVNAAARKEVYAVLSANGSLVNVHDGALADLVGALLGQSNYSLDPTDLESLENTLISVDELLAGLGLDEVTELLDEPLINVLDAVVDIVGGVGAPAGALVNDLTSAVGISGLDASAVLDISGDPSAAFSTEFPLYGFVMSVVLNSVRELEQSGAGLISLTLDSSSATALDTLLLDNPLLGAIDVTLSLSVDEPPRVVIGPARQDEDGNWVTVVTAADISVAVSADLELSTSYLSTLLGTLSLGLIQTELVDDIELPLVVQAGGGTASFVGASCARGTDNSVDLEILSQPAVVHVDTGSLDSSGELVPDTIHATILKLSILPLSVLEVCVDADLSVDLPVASRYQEVTDYSLYCASESCQETFTGDGDSWLEGLDADLENLALDCGETSLVSVLDSVIDLLTPTVETLLDETTAVLLQSIVSPLLGMLGADLSGLNVSVTGADQVGNQLIENVPF